MTRNHKCQIEMRRTRDRNEIFKCELYAMELRWLGALAYINLSLMRTEDEDTDRAKAVALFRIHRYISVLRIK